VVFSVAIEIAIAIPIDEPSGDSATLSVRIGDPNCSFRPGVRLVEEFDDLRRMR